MTLRFLKESMCLQNYKNLLKILGIHKKYINNDCEFVEKPQKLLNINKLN